MGYKSVTERYWDEQLTNNADLNHNSQCRQCIFRDRRGADGVEYGWKKCVCRIYGRRSADRMNKDYPNFFPYTPVEAEDKPQGVYDNTERCEYYEKEKKQE